MGGVVSTMGTPSAWQVVLASSAVYGLSAAALSHPPRAQEPVRAARHVVEGRVLQPDGGPAAGAVVQLAATRVLTDRDGGFRLELERCWPRAALVAFQEDFAPATVERLGARLLAGDELSPQTLVLGPPTRDLEGVLLDAAGRPLKLWHVYVESDVWVYRPETQHYGHPEDLAGGRTIDRTDGHGRFELRGLAPGPRRLVCLDRATMSAFRLETSEPAGQPDELRLPTEPALRDLELQLVDGSGVPVVGEEFELVRAQRDWRVQGLALGWSNSEGRLRKSQVATQGLAVQRAGCLHDGCGRVEIPDDASSGVLVVPDHRH